METVGFFEQMERSAKCRWLINFAKILTKQLMGQEETEAFSKRKQYEF